LKYKKNIDLIVQLTITSFKQRYEGSFLGFFWYLLNPVLTFLFLYFIFVNLLGSNIENYALYLLLGIIQWNFLSLAAGSSMKIIMVNSLLIKSLSFKRETLIISIVLMAFLSNIIELMIFFVILIFSVETSFWILLFPMILIFQFLFALGLAFFLSSVLLFFRDLENIWNFVSKVWWFATPVFYSVSSNSNFIYLFNLFNPMYHLIESSRSILVYGKSPDIYSLLAFILMSLISFAFGYLVFRHLKPKFAEMI